MSSSQLLALSANQLNVLHNLSATLRIRAGTLFGVFVWEAGYNVLMVCSLGTFPRVPAVLTHPNYLTVQIRGGIDQHCRLWQNIVVGGTGASKCVEVLTSQLPCVKVGGSTMML